MSVQNLKCKYQQLVTVAKANAAAKVQALKDSVIAKKNEVLGVAITAANAVIDPILAQASAAVASAKQTISNATDSAAALRDKLRALLQKNPEVCNVLPVSYDPKKPSENVTATVLALPSTNDEPVGAAKNKQALDDSKSIDINSQIAAIGLINKDLPNQGALELREYVRLLKNRHPVIDEYLKNLVYFQPVSDYVASSFLAYTPDKSSLLLEDWKTDKPKALRQNILQKIPLETQTTIEEQYQKMNKRLYSNISNEFFSERRPILNYCHGYHITGDNMWILNHMDATSPLMTQLIPKLATSRIPLALIEYITPINENITVENDYFDTTVEKLPVLVELKGNIVREPKTTVNNSALQPIPTSES